MSLPRSSREPDAPGEEAPAAGGPSPGFAPAEAEAAREGGAPPAAASEGSEIPKTSAAAGAGATPAAHTPPGTEEEEDEEPYTAARFFDNPSFGRALRYTFAEKRLARAVFVSALLLVVMLAGMQEVFGRAQLGLYHAKISFGRLAFLGMVGVEALLLCVLAPAGFLYLFEAERREESFDQVVASGVSPHRVVFGRFLACAAFVGVVLFSSLPFFLMAVVLDGASLGEVLRAYLVLGGFALALLSLSAASSVGLDDAALPVLIAVVAILVTLGGALSRRAPPEFAAFSPVRHLLLGFDDVARSLNLGSLKPPRPFGYELSCASLSLLYYGFLSAIGLGYAYVGPGLELTQGLDSFDSVATSRRTEARQARRGVARQLLRTVQMRFFYENASPRARRLAPALRLALILFLFAGAHAIFLGGHWPEGLPKGGPPRRLVGNYLGFCAVSFALVAFLATSSRSALLARHPIALGPLRLGKFPGLVVVVFCGLALPPLLWWSACALTGVPWALMTPERVVGLYVLAAGTALLVFAVGFLCSMLTTNPVTATGWTLVALFGLNIIPLVWLPLFTGNVVGPGSAFFLDFSPLSAGYAIARPGEPFSLDRYEGDLEAHYEHLPSWEHYAVFALVIGAACLVAAVVLAVRERRAQAEARA
ncbi:MAG: hypothetical protein D6731_12500 [Planctomycetota bacterium]|nr:MAG: hypothetical protein D6731_12500 [Planctomycetota bacterium]